MRKEDVTDSPEEYFSRFTEKELYWLDKLSRISTQQTSLKALKSMDRRLEMPTYCKNNLHILPAKRQTEWLNLQIAHKRNSEYLLVPGIAAGTVVYHSPAAIHDDIDPQTTYERYGERDCGIDDIGSYRLPAMFVHEQQVVH